jgi:3-hydroxyisobutyrate dehydrogenase-like beta-hydroxyacid dehydrogenase
MSQFQEQKSQQKQSQQKRAEPATSPERIAVLGLGAMGERMARRLMAAGHVVTVYNRTPERARQLVQAGAKGAATPREAAMESRVVLSMVRDDEASRQVWLDSRDGALAALAPDGLAIEASTLTPAWVEELSRSVEMRGTHFLEAPVVGSRPQAEAGQLIVLAGGSPAAFEAARPLLEPLAAAIHHAGPVGHGAVLKLAVNTLFAVQVAALGEVLGMVRKAGIDEQRAVEILGGMPVTSPAMRAVSSLMASKTYDPLFPIGLVEKDLGYAVEAARRADADVPTTEAVRAVYRQALEAGFGGDNIAGVAQLFG